MGEADRALKRAREEGAPPPALGDPDRDALHLTRLSELRRAKVYHYKGVGAFLDVREMYSKVEGAPFLLPGKKGITLTLQQAEALFAAGEDILAAMRAVAVGSEPPAEAAEAEKEGAGGGGGGDDSEEEEEEEEEEGDEDEE